jgi:DNA repair exonuclease SbcCD ATPase subunit
MIVKKILHIADVHIRNLKRHEEYRQVFDKLYESLKSETDENTIIYLGGDIAHAKLEMSPELVKEIAEFLTKCSEIAPTYLITGNHDCNMNNMGRLDVLTPIVDSLKLPNLFYLKDTQVFELENIRLVCFGIFDQKENWPKSNTLGNDKTNIALFHGAVDKSQTDIGYQVSSKNFPIEMFDGYDYALLGDIHKRQIMQEKSDGKPFVAYCGSLIQQNHGETLDKHGYMVWDIENHTYKSIDIPNDYGYYTLHIDNGIVPDVDDIPKIPRLRVFVSNTDSSQIKRVTTEIKKKYKVDDFTITRTDTLSKLKSGNRDGQLDIGNISDVEFQNGLITDYLKRNYPIDDDTLDRVATLNRDTNKKLKDEDLARNINWKPIRFEFSNMFSYGENNIVDFDKMRGIMGLFAANAQGKSSLFDSLAFCMFDKSSRAFKASAILNNRKTAFRCKLHFQINGEDFFIERVAKMVKKGEAVKVDVNFWRIEDGQEVSLNGTERRDTNNIISQYLGTYEDFVLTALSLQGNNSLFIDKSQSERKDLLSQFMGINVFDKLYELANEDIKEVQILLRNFKRNDFTTELASAENSLEELSDSYEEMEIEKEGYEDRQDELNEAINELSAQLVPMDGNLNIDDLNNRKSELTSSIEANEITIQNKTGKISDYFDVLIELKQLVEEKSKSNGIDIEVAYSNLQEEKKKLVEAEKVHSNAKLYLSLAEEKIKHLDNHKYDPNCKFCCDNTFVKDAMNAKTTLPELQQIVKDALIDAVGIQQTLDRWEGIEEQYNEWNTLKTKYEKGKNIHKNATLELSGLITQKELYESQLTNVEADIERYHTNEATIESNKILQQQIDDKKIELNDVTKYLRDINTKLLGVNGDIVKTNSYIKSIEDKMAEAKGLEEQYQIYEYYLDSIKRDGVSYELISKALPVIEGEVNNILHQIVDFGVTLQMDGKSINGKIVYDDQEWPLEMCSGMEKFISGLAIRVALINVCHLPRPNFLVIDEGFGTLDSENLTSMFMLFDYLKTQFDYIIVISHLDQMRDIVDNLIEIKKIDGFSSIIYK